MTEQDVRALVAEVLVLRNNPAWRAEDDRLVATGAVFNAQVGGAEISRRASYLRDLAPGPMLLQADLETGSHFAADGTELPPLMAIGAADSEELAFDWGQAVGLEGRRLGLDVTWSPVLDINTNPDNPIINVRSFGEDAAQVARLGAALTRGLNAGGLHPCAKHWPGHGDVAVDSHISLPTLPLTRRRLDEVEWLPYREARDAGLTSVMTAHLLVPEIDPHHCATVSPTLIALLRDQIGISGPIFTDSLGMEGLRTTLDSAEAAWRALAAGHDQVLIDYKRPPDESVEAVVAACLDGRVPLARLRDAAARVRALKQQRAALAPLPSDGEIAATLAEVGRRLAEASLTQVGEVPARLDLGANPLLVVADDLERRGVGVAEEKAGEALTGTHPLVRALRGRLDCEVLVLGERPTADELARAATKMAQASAVIGATFAHILCYKGDGTRLPGPQIELWRQAASTGKMRAMMLFESPYALADLPGGIPVVLGYGADRFTLAAACQGLLAERQCPGRLPVTAG